MAFNKTRLIYRLILLITIGLTAAFFAMTLEMASGSGNILEKYSVGWLGVLIVELAVAVISLVIVLLSFSRFNLLKSRFNYIVSKFLQPLKWFNVLFVVVMSIVLIWIVFYFQPDRLNNPLSLWWLLWVGALICTPFLFAQGNGLKWYQAFFSAIIAIGSIQAMSVFFLQVSDYPFSLGWSEGSRYYYASLFFSNQVYGQTLPLPVLHPSRYFLQSIPFVFPNPNIWMLRFWQALLWVVLPLSSGWLLARRLKQPSVLVTGIITLFAYTFFFQGPIYYHLIIITIPLLAGFNPTKPWRSLILVLLTSAWAGVSRVNWWPLPGALATLLFVLEEPYRLIHQKGWGHNLWKYFQWPFIWVAAGSITAYISNHLYENLSGNPAEVFGSAFSSPLLWYRLWPNATYGPGILLTAMLVGFFPIAMMLLRLFEGPRWHWARLAVLWGILLAFFLGGVLVSIKIGGGSNLHNMDAFILLLCVALLYIVFDQFFPDLPNESNRLFGVNFLLIFSLIMIPIGQVISTSEYEILPNAMKSLDSSMPDPLKTMDNISKLQKQVDFADDKGEILFLTDKQLVTFKTLKVNQFDTHYEKVFLMEMAMANNQDYLQMFYDDLANHRFSLIISEKLNQNHQDSRYAFSEENNAWADRIATPVLRYYQLVDDMPENNIYLYKPKP